MSTRVLVGALQEAAHRLGQGIAAVVGDLKRRQAPPTQHPLVVSNVFGAEVPVPRGAVPHSLPDGVPVGNESTRWDDALDFGPPAAAEPTVGRYGECPRDVSSANGSAACRDSQSLNELYKPLLTPPPISGRPEYLLAPDDAAHATHAAFRVRWQIFVVAACLLVAWIGAGQSGPLADQRPPAPTSSPAADALANRFSGSSEHTALADAGIDGVEARFQFAPRFAVIYADAASITGSVASGAADLNLAVEPGPDDPADDQGMLALSQDAAFVLIRNLPAGTTLSAGTRVSATDWALSPDDLKSIVVTLPTSRHGPVTANIEFFGMSGTPTGTVAVEIREPSAAPVQASNQRRAKVYRAAGRKSAQVKKRDSQTDAKAVTAKTTLASNVSASPAALSAFPQLPFLPGPFNPTQSPGTTVSQQILINLGVLPDVPALGLAKTN